MNSFKIMEALGDLPEQYYMRALPRDTKRKTSAVIPAPRFLTAAAVAACTVFAVGVTAMLLRGQQEKMILQSTQADSVVQEMTAAVREFTVTVAAELTEPVQTQTVTAAEPALIITAPESQDTAGEPAQTDAVTDAQIRIAITDRTERQETETETSAEKTESVPETTCTADDGIAQIDLSGDAVCEWASAAPPQYKVRIPQQGNTVFTWDTEQNMIAATCGEKTVIVSTEIRNVFFSDLNADGIPELCVGFTTSAQDTKGYLASDRFDKIVVYNPVSQKLYEPEPTVGISLMDGVHDYRLYAGNGNLIAERTTHPSAIFSNLPVTVTGRITLENDKLIFTETE